VNLEDLGDQFLRFEIIEYFNIPQEKLFEYLADGKMNDYLPNTVSNRIIRREGNLIFRETVRRDPRNGKEVKFESRDELSPPSKMTTSADSKRGRITAEFTLESQPSGSTKAVVAFDIKLNGVAAKILAPFFKGRILTSLRKESKSFKEYVEKEYSRTAEESLQTL
jgi:hypothetical protein